MSKLTEQRDQLKTLLRSIIVDAEAMQNDKELNYFGPFEVWWSDNDNQIYVEWPNLAILIEQAKKLSPLPKHQ